MKKFSDEKVSLRTIQTEDEIVIPDCLMAMIQYRMGEERYIQKRCFYRFLLTI